MDIVVAGHVNHGKSTIIGRLLADTHSLPDSKLEQVKALCARTAKPFEYAFLLDALKDERAQGITIDSARVFFKTPARDYLIIDAPGHIEFLKNMITGAARADAALLVIDAAEGVQENSRRHGYMMSMLGIRHVAVLVNKMDLVGYDQTRFARIEAEYREFLDRIGVRPAAFIPVAGRDGDNIATRSSRLPWYQGATVLDTLDAFPAVPAAAHLPFRMPVQDVYKFTNHGDNRRIVAGTVASGSAAAGDEVVFYPSGKRSVIKDFEAFGQPAPTTAGAGQAVGFTLQEQIYVARGEVATMSGERRPELSSRLLVSLFWLGRNPLVMGKDYVLKIGTARATVRLEALHKVIDASNLSAVDIDVGEVSRVERYEVAECTLACNRAIAFDADGVVSATSRFVIVDAYEICGGGIIREALADRQGGARERVLLREDKWEPSVIAAERRAERFGQRATLLIITGPRETDRKGLAKQLESRLFDEGRATYFLGMGNVLYGIGSDIARDFENRQEHVRRLAEIANLMLDAGMILIASAQELSADEMGLIKTTVDPNRIVTVWMGDRDASDVACDLSLSEDDSDDDNVQRVRTLLVDHGVLENDLGSRFLRENDSRGPMSASVLWFTGLSGSGKSALAHWVAEAWRRRGVPVEVLDGDAIRDVFPNTGFSKTERDAHVRRVGYLASRLEFHGVTVVASLVSPYKESRDFVRGLCRNFIEVHVSTPLEECERRDAKGLYAKARRGEIRNFTGIDDPYEPPEAPDLVIDTSRVSLEAAGQLVLDVLGTRLGDTR